MNKEKGIYELLPSEPVDVAAMLIKATVVTDAPVFALSPMLEGKMVAIPKYDPVQLQEIAEHLLVYCNAQENRNISNRTLDSRRTAIHAFFEWAANEGYNDSASDIRLKENVSDCEINALDAVCKMPVCSFDWKETGVHQPLGLVADDIEKIDPLLALGGGENEDGSMNVKQIDRLLLTEYAIKAIQELSAVVKEQSRKIRKLEEKLDGIKGN